VYQAEVAHNDVRGNSLAIHGDTLLLASQCKQFGQQPAGFTVYDLSDPIQPREVAFFDTSGPYSQGVHYVSLIDGRYAHITTGASDFEPSHPSDHQFYMIVDLRDRKNPREVGRWWAPGTMKGDACLPGCAPTYASRAHNIQVYPDRPDRAYVGYFGAGWFILDISGLADVKAGRAKTFTPKVVTHVTTEPVNAHTIQPIPGTPYAWAADETPAQPEGPNKCANTPKMLWLMDIAEEQHPHMAGWAPFAENAAELCQRPGRYGPYNLHMNVPNPTSRTLKNTMVATYFGGGLRIFRLVPNPALGHVPPRIVEIAHYIPESPDGAPAAELGGLLVADDGIIYVNDRRVGGLYVLRYTGKDPLD